MKKSIIYSCKGRGKDFMLFIKLSKKFIIKQYGFVGFILLSQSEKERLYVYWFRRLYFGELLDLPQFLKR